MVVFCRWATHLGARFWRPLQKAYFYVFAYSKSTFSFSTHRSSSLWSAHYPEEIHLERSDFGGRQFETVLAARPCLYNVILSDSKLVGRRKACNWLGILHKVSKIHFFQAIIHFTIFDTIILELKACLAQNNMAQEQPYPRVVVKKTCRKPFGQKLLHRMTSRNRVSLACLLETLEKPYGWFVRVGKLKEQNLFLYYVIV